MRQDRASILAELETAARAAQLADARLDVARAYEEVTARPGLWHRPIVKDRTIYVVGCNGVAIGLAWPAVRACSVGGGQRRSPRTAGSTRSASARS